MTFLARSSLSNTVTKYEMHTLRYEGHQEEGTEEGNCQYDQVGKEFWMKRSATKSFGHLAH